MSATIDVHIEQREDGGIRVWSDKMPGLILSGRDPDAVAANIWPAIKVLVWANAFLPPLYISGYFTDRINAGDRPRYL